MAFQLPRLGATIPLCALALGLAACNAQHQGELAANVAAGSNVEGSAAPTPGVQTAEAEAGTIDPGVDGAPLPPIRPDFAKLAKEREQQAVAANGAAAPSASAPASVETPSEGGVAAVAQAYAPARPAAAPTGIFAMFTGATADPAAPAQETANAPAQRASLIAYERRMTGEDATPAPATQTRGPETAAAAPPAASPSYTLAPAAVIEVAGVTRDLHPGASPTLIRPSPQIAGVFGMGGQNWRPAYDHVATNCFGPDLRAALENIARHFNSEVLVTSGHRTNGRRRSMHRFCRAADIRVVGVSPGAVARYASSVPGINGVGTYRRVAVTHIDTRANQMAWRY